MDSRFPQWLRTLVRKLEFIAVPNLGSILCGIAVVAFIANFVNPIPLQRFIFVPQLVLEGEWWRLFTFPFVGGLSNPIFVLFYCMYVYFVMNTLESAWGASALTLYVILGYLCVLLVSFVTLRPMDISWYLLEYLTLAYGTLYPNYELNLYGIIPVKAKWFAWLSVVFITMGFVRGGVLDNLMLPVAFLPYLVFFGPMLLGYMKDWKRTKENRKRFEHDMWR